MLTLGIGLGTSGEAASASQTSIDHWGAYFGGAGNSDGLRLSPTPIHLPGQVVQVATSNSTQYALLADGSVYAWGLGNEGQLGDDNVADSLTTPVRVRFPAGVTIAALPTDVMPYDTGLALDTTGHVWGWGGSTGGSLCLVTVGPHLTPVELPFTDVTALAGAGGHALYDSNGTVYACGANRHGQLGDGTAHSSTRPVVVKDLAGFHVRALVASFADSGVLLDNGSYLDWGYDGQGQLGDGKIGVDSSVPVTVPLPHTVTQVAQGGSIGTNGQTLVMLSDGSLRSWGDGQYGQLGDKSTATRPSPVAFSPPAGVTYERLASGGVTSYAESTTGALYSWGGGSRGQLGNGTTTTTQLTPVQVESGISLISATAQDVVTG